MKNQSGFSLIEFSISSVIVSILFMGVLLAGDHVRTLNKNEQVRLYASRIIISLTQLTSLKATIRASTLQTSIPENKAFADGIYRVSTNLHHNGDGSYSGISLVLPVVVVHSSKTIAGGQITGNPDYPLRYNLNGLTCNLAYQTCPAADWPIEVITDYNFTCPGIFHTTYDKSLRAGKPYYGPMNPDGFKPHTQCQAKSQLNLRLRIRQSKDSTSDHNMALFRDFVQVVQIPLNDWPTAANP